ncbi:MAG: type II toxin-antitoxin system RelB/DinJ family antitoxin [Kiritimatiellae bacterium]|nr:type II toxin-antitoxin system RelB/DinJ family antitoxin [Kiritimatiellia bacterium]
MATTSLSIRIDEDLKAEADEFFSDIGMNMTTAITCFFKKCLDTGEIPFKLGRGKHLPNAKTRAVLDRMAAGTEPMYGPYDSTEEMLKAALAMED